MDLETQVRWMYRLKRDNQLFTPNGCITFENGEYIVGMRRVNEVIFYDRSNNIERAFFELIGMLTILNDFDNPVEGTEERLQYPYHYVEENVTQIEEIIIAAFNNESDIIDAIQDTIIRG